MFCWRFFASTIISILVCNFICDIFVWFWYQHDAGFKVWVQKLFFFSAIVYFGAVWACLVELTSDVIWFWNLFIVSFFFFFLSSVQFSRSVMSNSLRPHESQHARPPCLLPTSRVHPNPCPSSQWCHPVISFSVVPFSFCPQSFPASGSFQWVSSSHQVAKVLEFQLHHQSFQWTPRTDLL